jgi:hypothetical protein
MNKQCNNSTSSVATTMTTSRPVFVIIEHVSQVDDQLNYNYRTNHDYDHEISESL